MVFSLFKKQPEKMASRPAVVARPAAGNKTPPPDPAPAAPAGGDDSVFPSDMSDLNFGFTESSLDFQVNTDFDPVNATAEEAAILFASHQDPAAQAILENALKQQRSGPAERLWLMLFDFYRLSGNRSAFDAMGLEYAHAFEKSPPGWGLESDSSNSAGAAKKGRGSLLFKGELLGGNTAAFGAARQTLEKNRMLHLDVSKVKQLDAEGCESLCKLMLYAKKEKFGFDLSGLDALAALVRNSVEASKAEDPAAGKAYWLLLFELLQRQGEQGVFEDTAIDYAVTFEESPPSWESVPTAPAPPEAEDEAADDGAYVLSGEVNSPHFDEMAAFAQERDALVIDCAKLVRIDFVSAGALLNTLTGIRSAGKQIAFRHPNRLVAELFRLVGLAAVASCVYAKN